MSSAEGFVKEVPHVKGGILKKENVQQVLNWSVKKFVNGGSGLRSRQSLLCSDARYSKYSINQSLIMKVLSLIMMMY